VGQTSQRNLESYRQIIKESEKRRSALHAISMVVNRSLDLEEMANTAIDKIIEVTGVDAILLFMFKEGTKELELKVYRGVSEKFARSVENLKLSEELSDKVTRMEWMLGEQDSPLAARLSQAVVEEGIKSTFNFPLKSRNRIVGALCIAMRNLKQFTSEEEGLLTLIAAELAIAIERNYFYQESQLAMKRFQELFEKANDAIWVQDFEGKITTANQATAILTGYELEDLIGRNVAEFLTSQALKRARDIRQQILRGEPVWQPYEQRMIRKNGEERILMITTSVIGYDEGSKSFQHIARDITYERQLQEDLRLYIDQITGAHEEERNRIARELHDETAQSLIAMTNSLDKLVSKGNKIPKEVKKSIRQLQKDIDNVLVGIRRFIQDLRPPSLEYLGLIPALRELVFQIKMEQSLAVDLSVEGTPADFTKKEELLIYRIVQEALNNVWKHSKATKVDVVIQFRDWETTVTVSDNGSGFEQQEGLGLARSGKLGLVGMQERARLLEGTLTISSRLGKGTTVVLNIPNKNNFADYLQNGFYGD